MGNMSIKSQMHAAIAQFGKGTKKTETLEHGINFGPEKTSMARAMSNIIRGRDDINDVLVDLKKLKKRISSNIVKNAFYNIFKRNVVKELDSNIERYTNALTDVKSIINQVYHKQNVIKKLDAQIAKFEAVEDKIDTLAWEEHEHTKKERKPLKEKLNNQIADEMDKVRENKSFIKEEEERKKLTEEVKKEATEKHKTLSAKLDELNAKISKAKGEKAEKLRSQIKSISDEIRDLNDAIKNFDKKIKESKTAIKNATKELNETESKIKEDRVSLKKLKAVVIESPKAKITQDSTRKNIEVLQKIREEKLAEIARVLGG